VLDPVPGLVIALASALLFGVAAWQKLRSWPQFAAALAAYGVVPAVLARPVALVIPAAEAAIAAGLTSDSCRSYAALAGCVLLLAYAAGIGANLWRGRLHLDCGCSGPGDRRPIAKWMVVRNALIALALAMDAAGWAPRALGATDALTVAAAATAVVILYSAATLLLSLPMSGETPNPSEGS